MRYTKPTILNDSKATTLIMGTQFKRVPTSPDSHPLPPQIYSDGSAYEADE